MTQKHTTILVVILICLMATLLPWQFSPKPILAGGGDWVIDNNTYWTITQTCRNGAYLDMLESQSTNTLIPINDLFSGGEMHVDITPMLFGEVTDPTLYERQINSFDLTYAPLVAEQQTFRVQPTAYETEPINVSLQSGAPTRSYYLYQLNNIIRWPQDLPIGTNVFIKADGGKVDIVQDCYVPSLEAESGYTISSLDVGHPYTHLNPESISFELTSAPNEGSLLAEDSVLSVGGLFNADQVNAGQIRYETNSTINRDDIINFVARSTVRVSVANDGSQATGTPAGDPFAASDRSWQPSISANGSKIAFTSSSPTLSTGVVPDTNGTSDIFLRTLSDLADSTKVISTKFGDTLIANRSSQQPDISAEGNYIVYTSLANNILEEDIANPPFQIFKKTLTGSSFTQLESYFKLTPITDRDPINSANSHSPSISRNGARVAFHTFGQFPNTNSFANDLNNDADILINLLESTSFAGSQLSTSTSTGNDGSFLAEISDDGIYVAYETDASNLVSGSSDINSSTDIVIREIATGSLTSYASVNSAGTLAQGGDSNRPQISRFGKHVVFDSSATNLAHNGTTDGTRHVYVHDRAIELDDESTRMCTILLSQDASGEHGNGDSMRASISSTGRFVAFQSIATNLIDDDTNGASDIFVVDRDADGDYSFYSDPTTCTPGPSRIFRVSIAGDGTPGNGNSIEPAISGNGDFVAFTSAATNLVNGDTNGMEDVFLHYIGYEGIIRFGPEETEPIETPIPTETPIPPTATPSPPLVLPFKTFLPVGVKP